MLPPTSTPVPIELALVAFDRTAWPRQDIDRGRVAEMIVLYGDGGPTALPPPEVVPLGDGRYVPRDGWHRCSAAVALGMATLPMVVIDPPDGTDPVEFAYLGALESSATAARPLSRAERRTATRRLIANHPQWSDHDIARRVGFSHQTVGRIRKADIERTQPEPELADEYIAAVSARRISDQLARALAKAWQARGITDLVKGRMPGTLAASLEDVFGDEALEWAGRLERWAADARQRLEQDG